MRVGVDSRSGHLRSIHNAGRSIDRAGTVVPHCQSSPERGRNTWLQNLANTKVRGDMAVAAMFAGGTLLAIERCVRTESI